MDPGALLRAGISVPRAGKDRAAARQQLRHQGACE